MPDSKITALTSISTSTDPANDPLVIVDVSDTSMAATGTTKKVTLNNLLACSPTATLASATITGDLTVDTSTLKVDSANDNVGIGTTTPASYAFNDPVKLVIANTGTAGAGNTFTIASGSTGFGQIAFANGTSGTSRYNGYIKYSHSTNAMEFYANAGALQATLNSTGLGVGGSPVNPITAYAAASAKAPALLLTTAGSPTYGWDFSVDGAVNGNLFIRRLVAGTKTDVLEFDRSNGNVGIGVTPSGTIYSSDETRLVVKGTSTSYAGTVGVQSKGTTNAVTGFLTAGDTTNEVAVGSDTNSPLNFYINGALKATIDVSGNLILRSSATPATLGTNGQLTVNATSNTNLRFSYRGSDGVTRVANITLA